MTDTGPAEGSFDHSNPVALVAVAAAAEAEAVAEHSHRMAQEGHHKGSVPVADGRDIVAVAAEAAATDMD